MHSARKLLLVLMRVRCFINGGILGEDTETLNIALRIILSLNKHEGKNTF